MRVISAFLLWVLCLSTAADAYPQASARTEGPGSRGSVVLTWSAPLARQNGSLLSPSELVGYQIYYTLEETGESTMIEIDDTRIDRYEFKDLAPGTYYFAVTAVDSKGQVSELSEMIQARVE